jgi:hypothetical protein
VTRRTIRASEIGAYLYCRRAWWYQKLGHPSQNQAEMAAGTDLHYRHGRAALRLGCLRYAAYALFLLALVLLALYLTNQVL